MEEIKSSIQAQEITKEQPPQVVEHIYDSSSSPADKYLVASVQKEILDPHDVGGVDLYKKLRESLSDLDTNEGWRTTKEAARLELRQIQPNYMEFVLQHYGPLMRGLPAGHGKGHMLRDIVNLSGMLNDPELKSKKIDEVELFVGIYGGEFHDIGNSIVDRHEDVKRVGAHAEVGAVLFGEVARDIIPPNLTKLIQYTIAAHTHYTKPRDVELSDGTIFTQRTYNDFTGGHGREAIWLARQADRRDTSSLAQVVRDMVVNVKPVQDFDGESFYEKREEEENFATQYGLSPEAIDKGIIGHEISYAKNVFKENPYTSHDSEYFTRELMTPGVSDLALLLAVIAPDKKDYLLSGIKQDDSVAADKIEAELSHYADTIDGYLNHEISDEGITESIAKFKHICRVIEPADGLEAQLQSFESQFKLLPPGDQTKWAKGFSFMADVLMKRWLDRLASSVAEDPHLGSKIASRDPVVQQQFEEIGRHLQSIAQQIITSMEQADFRP